MKCRITIVFFLLLLLACGHKKKNIQEMGENQNLYVIDVDKAEQEEKILLSDICSNAKIIILETNDDVLIGHVGGVQAYKDYIFVLDEQDSNFGLYAFNRDGKFIRRYGSRGIGPGEYLSIKDFTIDAENEIIYLLDDGGHQILRYDINTGRYINKIEIKDKVFNCFHLQYNNEKLYTSISYWHTKNDGCLLQEIDPSTGRQTQCWLDAERYNLGWDGSRWGLGRNEESFFYVRHQETCKYMDYFMDTIIAIGKNQIEPYAVIKDKDRITAKNLARIVEETHDIFSEMRERGYSFSNFGYMEWDDYICFNYMKYSYSYFVLYNKKTGNSRTSQHLVNDLVFDRYFPLVDRFVCSDENGLYEIRGMRFLDSYIKWIKEYDPVKKSLDKYEELMNLPEDTNPILFYYEFKRE